MIDSLNHIALIIDGNRRWAKERGLNPWKGHREGAKAVDRLLDNCIELGIKQMTIYTLSIENLNRDKLELKFLFKLFKMWFGGFRNDKRINDNKIKIKFAGDLSLVPKDIQKVAAEIEDFTKDFNKYQVNFCFSYSGRSELLHAFNKLKNKEDISEKDIEEALWIKHSPDLVIRTGGQKRLSNFLPWQSTYSELIFLDKLWPDFNKQDLLECVGEFESRKRNFGK